MTEHKDLIGKAKGGKALADKMTIEERKAKSLAMVDAKKRRKEMPKATHDGILIILDIKIPCYVLSNGQRVLSQRGISEAFTGNRGGEVLLVMARKKPLVSLQKKMLYLL
ncbi:hypothetical protein [Methylocucumis oryzae]|uniref:hypothetical protein n=1 Tax=Methylocucumis oryzae TaxID=1632867 RepID=UPI000697B95D|nr:hypothetical protein [Methylocucumis oryzae]